MTAQEPDVRERLIVALDVPDVARARAMVEALDGVASFFKIGLYLQLLRGTERFIDELLDAGRKVFIDYKYGDIPATVRAGVRAAAGRGVDFLTVQGQGEMTRAMLEAAVEGKRNARPRILFVTLLTSLDAGDLGDGGDRRRVEDLVRDRARLALEVGLDGVIASGREVRAIRELAGPDRLLIVTPGIRPVGAAADDHKRAATPAEAIAAGADYLVVGRPIVGAGRPRAAAEAILDDMRRALEARG